MKVSVLFAQRKERYNGEYGLEAIACMTEHDEEANPSYLPDTLEQNRQSGDFKSLAIVTLNVSEADVRKILQPESTEVSAEVLP